MSDVLDPTAALRSEPPAASTPQGLADQLTLGAIALNRTRMPMVVTDPRQPNNPIVLANQAFLDLTGYRADEVVGHNPRFMQGPGTDADHVAQIRTALADGREITIEVLNYRKDGSTFWNELHISPIRDEAGELLYYFASQDDVTEFRKVQALEATERRLLKEVDHRARNVLAVVNGIVRLSRADNAKEYATAIQQRVQALASAHTLLADGGWRDVVLGQVIQQQLDGLGLSRVETAGPDVPVSAFVVQPLALVIHELLSNAMLHGALSTQSGALTITWEPGETAGGFRLHWTETHGPAPISPRRSGFGTSMLRGMIERQLRGHIEQTFTDAGLEVSITVPGPADAAGSPA